MAKGPAFARAWFEQAEADLRAAELSVAGGAYEWTCFLGRTELPVEPVVVRPETLARRLEEGHGLFVRALEEGVRLYPVSVPDAARGSGSSARSRPRPRGIGRGVNRSAPPWPRNRPA